MTREQLIRELTSLHEWSFRFETILPMEGSDCQHVDETDRLRVALKAAIEELS